MVSNALQRMLPVSMHFHNLAALAAIGTLPALEPIYNRDDRLWCQPISWQGNGGVVVIIGERLDIFLYLLADLLASSMALLTDMP
jgi:hypothetical protein